MSGDLAQKEIERNYLAALFNAHPLQVILARDEFRKKLFENFREGKF